MGLNVAPAGQATLIDGTDMDEPLLLPFAGGHLSYFTQRAPDKSGANEDALGLIPWGADGGVLAVCDGLGGQPAGKQASLLALQCLAERVVATPTDRAGGLREAILDGIEQANRNIAALGVGAATTLALVEIHGRSVRSYHVGDSMILVTGQRGRIKLQTVSHSPVGYAVESGFLDAAAAMHHEERHLISNALGAPSMRIEIGSRIELAPRDTVLLASDGLFDNLHLPEIVEWMRCGPVKTGAKRLRSEAVERMRGLRPALPSKPDDLSFILFRAGAS